MERDGQQCATFVAGFIAPQIQIVRDCGKVLFRRVLREHKKREAFCERRRCRLAIHNFPERAGKFVTQSFRRFEAGVDRFVHGPKCFTRDERIRVIAARPIRQHAIG